MLALRRADVARAVHEAGRLGSGGRHAHGFRSALVVVQLSVSVALLVGAGLLTKSFFRMQQSGPGFNVESVWTARIAVPAARYESPEARALFLERSLEELAALPGVVDAGFTSHLPFTGNNWTGDYAVDGYVPPAGASPPHAQHRAINEGFLPSLDIPVVRGRNFAATEAERVVLVDENLANTYWPGEDPLGRRVAIEIGLALGFVAALALGRVMASQIYEVGASDPAVFAIALAGLASAALLASWLPARRASRIDPMNALREE